MSKMRGNVKLIAAAADAVVGVLLGNSKWYR